FLVGECTGGLPDQALLVVEFEIHGRGRYRRALRSVRMAPETLYTRSGELYIAYQVVGDGSIDIIWVPGWISNIDHYWEEPAVARYFNRIASFSRLILFDRRGTGVSDPVPRPPT